MSIIKKLNTPFFLTGGTALSRHYFNHRYSDDLDLFVNSSEVFNELAERELISLTMKGSPICKFDNSSVRKFENFAQFFVSSINDETTKLKVELVNDVAQHFGNNQVNETLGLIDSWRNILSNKLSALFRFEPKDIADIWIITKHKNFNWIDIMNQAKSKEAAVEPEVVYNIIKSFPNEELNLIKWSSQQNINEIKKDLEVIAEDIFWGLENSLVKNYLA